MAKGKGGNNNGGSSINTDVHTFIKDLYENDPKKLVRILDMMKQVYDEAPPGSQLANDWVKINAEMNAEDADLIARAYDSLDAEPEHAKGYEGWDSETVLDDKGNVVQDGGTFEQMYGKPRLNKEGRYAVNELVLPGLGAASKTIGRSINDYRSILGEALGAMANIELQKASTAAPRNSFDTSVGQQMHMNKAMNMLNEAGKKKAIGAVANDIGTGIGSYIEDIARANKSREEVARQSQLMMNEHPVSDFWRDQSNARNMRKHSAGGSN